MNGNMNINSLDANSLPLDSYEQESAQSAQSAAGAFAQIYSSTLDNVTGEKTGLPGNIGAPIKQLCWDMEMTVNNGVRSLQTALGMPQSVPVADRQTGQIKRGTIYPEMDTALAHAVMNQVAQQINALEKDAQDPQGTAARLVAEVYRASAQTDLPRFGANETRQAELKADMVGMLDSCRTPQAIQETALNLINKFVAENDDEALSVLLGKRTELARQRLGLDYDALCRQVFRARLDKVGGDPYALGAPRYARFLAAQWDGNTSLGAVMMKAAQRLRQEYTKAKRHAGR